MTTQTEPRLCPHCGNVTPHEEVFQCSAPALKYGQPGVPEVDEFSRGSDFLLIRCQTCKDVSLYSKPEGTDYQWDEAELLYPSQYDLHTCIPEAISMNYREAKRVQRISPNAFAVLLRRSLETVCDERGVPPGPLARRLKDLSGRGEIPGKLADISTVLRELGNAGAHNTTQRVTAALTWTMDQFFRTLLEYVYVAPHRLAEFQKSLKRYEESEQAVPVNPPSSPAQPGC